MLKFNAPRQRGLRGPGLTTQQQADLNAVLARFTLPDGRFETTVKTLQQPLIDDLSGRGVGGPGVYLPLDTFAIIAPRLGINSGFTPGNTPVSDIPGYWKLAVPSSASNVHTVVHFNATTSRYVSTVYPDEPSAPNGVIAVCQILGGIVVPAEGVKVISYDEWKLGTQAWPDLAATDREIIHDVTSTYGSGARWMVPLRFYNARGFVDADFTVNNPESSFMPGYCEVLISNPNDAHLLAFNTQTGMFINYSYAQLKTVFAQGGASIIRTALAWRGQVFSDFPVRSTIAPDPIIAGSHLFLVEGRPLPFYPQTLYADRQAVNDRVTTIRSVGSGKSDLCGPMHWLRAEEFGATATITSRTNTKDAPDKQEQFASDVTIVKGPPRGSGPFIIAPTGDSMQDEDTVGYIAQALLSFGHSSVVSIGTRNTTSTGTYKDEGRSGWQIADFTGENNRYPGIADTPEAWTAYMNMSEADKRLRNPFLRLSLPSDPPDRKFLGLDGQYWTPDYRFYLNRAGLPDPDAIPLIAGTNDVYQAGGVAAADRIIRSFNIMLDTMRAACPNAATLIVQVGYSRTQDQDDRWANEVRIAQVATLKAINAYRRANGDTKNWYVAAYQHQNPEDGYATNLVSTDILTGTQLRVISDGLHPIDQGRAQLAAAIASACHATKYAGYAGQPNAALLASMKDSAPAARANIGAVGLTGAETIAGAKTFSSSAALDDIAGGGAFIRFLTSGVTRWSLGKQGGGAGFAIDRHSAAGAYVSTSVFADASTGVVTVPLLAASTLSIGSTTPIAIGSSANPALAMHGTTFNASTAVFCLWSNTSNGPSINLGKSRGATVGAFSALAVNDNLGSFVVHGDDGTALFPGASFNAIAAEAWTASARGTIARVFAVPIGATALAEVARFQAGVGFSMFGANVVIDQNRAIRRRVYTFATLPAQPYAAAAEFEISDGPNTAPAWGAAAAGGGSTSRPVRSTGSAYVFG
ncbi:hypothetical protein [Sphingobium sp.]|uniref:hypothetical protein n=1 Tax=Sphingobium sp. TaxID=1912891 RepID=UPI00257A0EB3|nr:hypothetical protein [Sphingobium sp.]MBR2268335.1 hypothetical protein [Sphingobium sp.]